MSVDPALLKAVDSVLDDEETNVLLAFKVSKNQAAASVFGRKGRLQSKPRVLAVTAKRNPQTQKFNVRIHVLKTAQNDRLELAKSYKLSTLTSIEAEKSDSTGRSFYLVFDAKKDASLAQWQVRSMDDRNQLLVTLLKMSRENLGKMPKVVGIDVVEMALWAQQHAKRVEAGGAVVPSTLTEREEIRKNAQTMEVHNDLVSKVEEDDMEALLDTYVIGIDEAEAFSERLKRELAALEAANVHAILGCEALVEEVVDRLDEAADSVEDMNEWLTVLNLKVRHMRNDIESIEVRNNRLEVQSANQEGLLGELNKLLDCLQVPDKYSQILTGGPFDDSTMPATMEACDWLCDIMDTLQPAGKEEESFAAMRAVREKRSELEKLKQTFVRRATDFLRNFFAAMVEQMVNQPKGQLKPDHRELRWKAKTYARLLQQIKQLDPSALVAVRKGYTHSINLLLRREAREFAGELKATTRVGGKNDLGGGGGGDAPSLSDTAGASDSYSRMLHTILPLLAEEALFFSAYLCFEAVPCIRDEESLNEYADLMPINADGTEMHPEDASEEEMRLLMGSLEELMDGIQDDFFSLLDWCYKIEPLRCIPMMAATEEWMGSEGGEDSIPFQHKLLGDLRNRIQALFFKYVEEAAAQIEKFANALKPSGVLPFIPSFAVLATKMETLGRGGKRGIIDEAYNRLVQTMFSVLEKIASADAKSADVLLLENYAAFQNSTYDLAGSIPTLRLYYQQASEAYELACSKYIDNIITTQFEVLFAYKQKVKQLLVTIEAEEIPFQIGFSKVDWRKVMKTQLATPDKSMAAMFQRMKRQLTSASGDLLPSLWAKCQEDFLEKYEEVEQLVARCYNNEAMQPSSAEMRDLLSTIQLS